MAPNYKFEILDPEVCTQTDEGLIHNPCGALIMSQTVRLSNRTGYGGGFANAGNGEVTTVTVPYCGGCEDRPQPHGTITDQGVISHPSFAIDRESQE